tara:strand:+ start:464 stop:1081 length:618 start_codon:yes stop_codon:yes gene_type:complete
VVAERDDRNLEIFRQVCSGKTKTAVANEFNLTRNTIILICKKISKLYYEERFAEIENTKGRQSEQLNILYRNAMEAFEASKGDITTTVTVTHPNGKLTEQTITKPCAGDPRFINEARRVLESERQMWGANAPEQHEHKGNFEFNMSVSERMREVTDRIRKHLPGAKQVEAKIIPEDDGGTDGGAGGDSTSSEPGGQEPSDGEHKG